MDAPLLGEEKSSFWIQGAVHNLVQTILTYFVRESITVWLTSCFQPNNQIYC